MYADAAAWVKRVQEEERDKAAREWADQFFDAQRKSYVAGRADALDAAREAVAALPIRGPEGEIDPPEHWVNNCIIRLDALTAIDDLKGGSDD